MMINNNFVKVILRVMGGQEWRHEGEESKINLTVKILFDSVDFIIKLVNQGWKQFGFYRRVCWGE